MQVTRLDDVRGRRTSMINTKGGNRYPKRLSKAFWFTLYAPGYTAHEQYRLGSPLGKTFGFWDACNEERPLDTTDSITHQYNLRRWYFCSKVGDGVQGWQRRSPAMTFADISAGDGKVCGWT